MNKKEAFKIVLNELKQNPLCNGIYDVRHGNEHFMYGVATIMEAIAARISDEEYEKFNDEFMKNMVISEERS